MTPTNQLFLLMNTQQEGNVHLDIYVRTVSRAGDMVLVATVSAYDEEELFFIEHSGCDLDRVSQRVLDDLYAQGIGRKGDPPECDQ